MQISKLLFILCVLIGSSQVYSQTLDSTQASAIKARAFGLDSLVRNDPSRQNASFNSGDSSSLPLGIVKKIGGTTYIICIDSARFKTNESTFDVFMCVQFPGSNGKLAFYAKNVPFNPEGVMNSSAASPIRLQLAGNAKLKIGSRNYLEFLGDGSNYIQWNCNGYEKMHMKANVVFSKEIIVNAINPNEAVKGLFELEIADLSKIMMNITVPSFIIPKLDDFVFNVTEMGIDRNDSINLPGFVFNPKMEIDAADPGEWMGFFAKNISVQLPDSWNRGSAPSVISVTDLYIDDRGVTGDFMATNVFTTADGKMDAWDFSLDKIQLDIVYNKILKGKFEGKVLVPQLDDAPMEYYAMMARNSDTSRYNYEFTISPSDTLVYNLQAFKSTAQLYPSSSFTVSIINKKFVPSAFLCGRLDYNGGTARLKQLTFENLHLISKAPYISSGTFALTTGQPDSNTVARLPLSINTIGLGIANSNVVLSVGISLVLGDTSANSFAASTTLLIHSKLQTTSSGRVKIKFDRIDVQDIALSIQTTPFVLDGVLAIRKNDPTYGDLFFGSVSFSIVPIMKEKRALVSIGFGKVQGMKYWFVDLGIPITIPVAPALNITALYGGVSNRVQTTMTTLGLLDRAFSAPSATAHTATRPIPFIPNPDRGLSFFAGAALETKGKEDVFNGEVLLAVTFNSNGGLNTIDLAGRAYMLVKRSERNDNSKSKVFGSVVMQYDHPHKTFDAEVIAAVNVPSTLTGNARIKIHIDTSDWYFWINTPSDRANLSLLNVFTIDAYFMVGTQTPSIPPPPAYVTNIVSASAVMADLGPVSTGDGFAFGSSFNSGFNAEVSVTDNWKGFASANFGGGLDVALLRLSSTAHCEGSSSIAGINRWYAQGQAYAYLSGSYGAKRKKADGSWQSFNVGSIAAAALLQGRLPKPSYFYGAVGLQVTLLNIVDFSFSVDVEVGNNCAIIN